MLGSCHDFSSFQTIENFLRPLAEYPSGQIFIARVPPERMSFELALRREVTLVDQREVVLG